MCVLALSPPIVLHHDSLSITEATFSTIFVTAIFKKPASANLEHEECEMVIAISTFRADSAFVPGVAFK